MFVIIEQINKNYEYYMSLYLARKWIIFILLIFYIPENIKSVYEANKWLRKEFDILDKK